MALQIPPLPVSMSTSSPKVPHFGKLYASGRMHWQRERYVMCLNGGKSNEPPKEELQSVTSAEAYLKSKTPNKLDVGSPIIVIEAPQWIKTATAMPSLRVNSGHINAGDVGRWIMSRKPKDVWAIRFRIGTYLIDGKYIKALDLQESS